nr:response regulator [candidate division Zixibacteria bacterium]
MTDPAEKTILVVDDEDDVRNFLELALVEAGFKVRTAADGFEALEEVKKQVPDLISLDLVMPKKSGAKFHRDLTKNKAWANIPIIIVTGHARDDLGKADLKELTMSGPGIYLEKPIRPDKYVAAVKRILGLDSTDEEKEMADQVELQNELKNLIDEADPETLKKLRKIINKKK